MFTGQYRFMNKEDHSDDFEVFKKITKDLDVLRGQSLAESAKELSDLLKEFGVKV